MTWHTDVGMLRGYQEGALGAAHEASVEAHLASCAECRDHLATLADRIRLDRSWSVIVDQLNGPPTTLLERALVRLGIGEPRARLVALTPVLRSPSALAMVAALFGIAALNVVNGNEVNLYVFLVVAPLLPLAGVAAAFGSIGDPVRELAASTPTSAFELLLVRTLTIVGVTTLVTAGASAVMPYGWASAAWLLPSLGLTALVMALATWMPVQHAGVVVGGVWTVGATISWRGNRFDHDALSYFVALRPSGQLALALLTVAAGLVCALRREAFDLRRFA